MPCLPNDFIHPERVELATGHHLRPIRESDVDIEYPAVMGSRTRLWSKYGDAWGWPPPDMTLEADRVDLARHEAEIAAHLTFNYAVLDEQRNRAAGLRLHRPAERRQPGGCRRGGLVVGRRPARWRPSRTRARRVRPALAGAGMALPRRPLHSLTPSPTGAKRAGGTGTGRAHSRRSAALPRMFAPRGSIRMNRQHAASYI